MDGYCREDFKEYLCVSAGLASSESLRSYTSRINKLLEWLNNFHLKLCQQSIQSFLFERTKRGDSASTINSFISALKHYHNYLIQNGVSIDLWQMKYQQIDINEPDLWTPEEIKKLISANVKYGNYRGEDTFKILNHKYQTIILLIYMTGFRIGEALNLQIKNVHDDYLIINRRKNKTGLKGLIEEPLKTALKIEIGNRTDGLVFVNILGKRIDKSNVNRDIIKRAKVAGINKPIHPHLLRHCFATHLKSRGADLVEINKLLGQKSLNSTLHYIHTDIESLQKAMMAHPFVSSNMTAQKQLKTFFTVVKQHENIIGTKLFYEYHISENEVIVHVKTKLTNDGK